MSEQTPIMVRVAASAREAHNKIQELLERWHEERADLVEKYRQQTGELSEARAEVERLRARVAWLERDGKCQSLHKMDAQVERLTMALRAAEMHRDVFDQQATDLICDRCQPCSR